jgi:hypothetical protein
VLKTLLVIFIGLLPSLFSLWVIRKTHSRTRLRMRQALRICHEDPSEITSDLLKAIAIIWKAWVTSSAISVAFFNARSGYMRCAINPSGPCQNCRHYEPLPTYASKYGYATQAIKNQIG